MPEIDLEAIRKDAVFEHKAKEEAIQIADRIQASVYDIMGIAKDDDDADYGIVTLVYPRKGEKSKRLGETALMQSSHPAEGAAAFLHVCEQLRKAKRL